MLGWETLYEIAMQQAWFDTGDQNKLQAVFYADAEELISNISKYNLMKL